MNLSTARSALRAKEIGIRKVVGAQRKEIIAQFLSESVLITYVSLLIAFGLTVLLLPAVNKMSNLQLNINSLVALAGFAACFITSFYYRLNQWHLSGYLYVFIYTGKSA